MPQYRVFSGADAVMSQEQQRDEQTELDLADENKRLGVDTEFSTKKHAYVLTFPWNFDEIIDQYENTHRPVSSGFWKRYTDNSECKYKFAELFREFHQSCARFDKPGIEHICEPRLAQAVNESLERIHFHGLDIEMANLTAYPDMKVLKVEVSHGLQVDRSSNGSMEDYTVTETTLLGQKCTYYVPKGDQSDVIDGLAYGRKPYCVAITCAIESPMKLFVQNQNYSKILLGSDN